MKALDKTLVSGGSILVQSELHEVPMTIDDVRAASESAVYVDCSCAEGNVSQRFDLSTTGGKYAISLLAMAAGIPIGETFTPSDLPELEFVGSWIRQTEDPRYFNLAVSAPESEE